jgi:hypothetical protein
MTVDEPPLEMVSMSKFPFETELAKKFFVCHWNVMARHRRHCNVVDLIPCNNVRLVDHTKL